MAPFAVPYSYHQIPPLEALRADEGLMLLLTGMPAGDDAAELQRLVGA